MNGYAVLGRKQARLPMTVIEIRPYNGWQVYDAPGVQLVFLNWETSDLSLQICASTKIAVLVTIRSESMSADY
jgi:hypothetical protein